MHLTLKCRKPFFAEYVFEYLLFYLKVHLSVVQTTVQWKGVRFYFLQFKFYNYSKTYSIALSRPILLDHL